MADSTSLSLLKGDNHATISVAWNANKNLSIAEDDESMRLDRPSDRIIRGNLNVP